MTLGGLLIEKTIGSENLQIEYNFGETSTSLLRLAKVTGKEGFGWLLVAGNTFLFFQSVENWYITSIDQEYPVLINVNGIEGLQIRINN